MMRTSTLISSVPPRRLKVSCSMARRNFAWTTDVEFADLIKEKRAAMGEFEAADLLLRRVSKSASFITEQLALHQIFRQARRSSPPRKVSSAGHYCNESPGRSVPFRAAFTGNQHRAFFRRHHADRFEDVDDLLGLADDVSRCRTCGRLPPSSAPILSTAGPFPAHARRANAVLPRQMAWSHNRRRQFPWP